MSLEWIQKYREVSIEALRIFLGLGLLLKGVNFLLHQDQALYFLQMGRVDFSTAIIAHYVILAHLFGGAFFMIGMLTRAAAIAQIPVLMGAVFFVHREQGLFSLDQSLEFSMLVLFMLCVFSVYGGGQLSVDYVLEKRAKRTQDIMKKQTPPRNVA